MMKIQLRHKGPTGKAGALSVEQRKVLQKLYELRYPADEVARFFKLQIAAVYYHYKIFKLSGIKQAERPAIQDLLRMEGYE